MRRKMKERGYQRNLIAGAIGAFGMLLGDLSLSLVEPGAEDAGLFLREAYLQGGYPAWKLVLLLISGMIGVFGYWFGLKAVHASLDDRCKKTKCCFRYCSMIYCFTGLAIHFGIGAGAYMTSYVAANIGRDAAISIATEYGTHIVPAFYIVYPAMGFLFLALLVMTVSGKTIYSKKMLLVQPIIWMAVGALIPDIKQALGCRMYTLDYVITQSSGNFAPFIYFLACLLLPESFKMKKGQVCK